ncbi:MAG: hypothetical protein QM790_08040 [Nibricoccus sp.]
MLLPYSSTSEQIQHLSGIWSSSPRPHGNSAATSPNLFDLFVENLNALYTASSQICRIGQLLCDSLPISEKTLRHLANGLIHAGCSCLPSLPDAIRRTGISLRSACRTPISGATIQIRSLLTKIEDSGWDLIGIRVVSTLERVALNIQLQVNDAAEDAALLGSESLAAVLSEWAAAWREYLSELDYAKREFRVRAYAAGLKIPEFDPEHPMLPTAS